MIVIGAIIFAAVDRRVELSRQELPEVKARDRSVVEVAKCRESNTELLDTREERAGRVDGARLQDRDQLGIGHADPTREGFDVSKI